MPPLPPVAAPIQRAPRPYRGPPPPVWSSPGVPHPRNDDGDSDDGEDNGERFEVGMTAETRDLYRDDPREAWEEWAPEDISNSTSTSASKRFALIVRRQKQINDAAEPVLMLHSIKVQSPLIKTALEPVFKDFEGIKTNLKKLEFKAPFSEFFYRWTEFVNAKPSDEGDENKQAREHFDLLFNIMHAEMKPHLEQAADLVVKNKVVSYEYLWTLFEPNTEIYSNIDGQDRLFQFNKGRYVDLPTGARFYSLSCRYVDTDGQKFGFASTTISIPHFEDVKPLVDLSVLPSYLQGNIDEIRQKLLARGRKFEALNGCHYRAYTGRYHLKKPPIGTEPVKYTDGARVMIDGDSFRRYTGQRDLDLQPLQSKSDLSSLGTFWSLHAPNINDDDEADDPRFTPPHMLALKRMVRQTRRMFSKDDKEEDQSLTDQQCILSSPTVKGYCFKDKRWAQFFVDGVQGIVWNTAAFERLVLPHDYKSVVWAFVDAQLTQADDFDDVIEGKGKGMIMLLSGEPGTGKTLTSESVSEAMKKPLYSMSAGELGIDAEHVEESLGKVLELSKKWNAVLLLDECDVFLEKRSTSDLHRNQLVSVFLRLLEYYQGVMFLTTNRAASFDPAFESRIDLTLHYPDLDFDSRLNIWRTFVEPGSSKTNIAESELAKLAEADMNGRQIKNVVKTARLLASRDKVPLGFVHVETVLRVKRGERAYQLPNGA